MKISLEGKSSQHEDSTKYYYSSAGNVLNFKKIILTSLDRNQYGNLEKY